MRKLRQTALILGEGPTEHTNIKELEAKPSERSFSGVKRA